MLKGQIVEREDGESSDIIYIYAFIQTLLSKATNIHMRWCIFFLSFCVTLVIEPTTFWASDLMQNNESHTLK